MLLYWGLQIITKAACQKTAHSKSANFDQYLYVTIDVDKCFWMYDVRSPSFSLPIIFVC